MLKAPDFDRKMLLLATQISHQSEMKAVLLSVLEALLKTLKVGDSGEVVVEAMTLIRCIIRLALGLLVDPAADKLGTHTHIKQTFLSSRYLPQDCPD